jgi:hypothetical protein
MAVQMKFVYMFMSGNYIKSTVMWWFQQQRREFFVEGIHYLVSQWEACLIASIPLPRTVLEWD